MYAEMNSMPEPNACVHIFIVVPVIQRLSEIFWNMRCNSGGGLES